MKIFKCFAVMLLIAILVIVVLLISGRIPVDKDILEVLGCIVFIFLSLCYSLEGDIFWIPEKKKNVERVVSSDVSDIALVNELKNYGYTKDFIDLSIKRIIGIIDNPQVQYDKYCFHVFNLVEAYLFKKNYDEALNWLCKIDENELINEYSKKEINKINLLTFWNYKMSIYKETVNSIEAKYLYEKVESFIRENIITDGAISGLINEFYYKYYYTMGDYIRAKEYVNRLRSNNIIPDENAVYPELLMAEVSKALDDDKECEKRMLIAKDLLATTNDNHTDNMIYNKKIDMEYEKNLRAEFNKLILRARVFEYESRFR